MSTRRIYRRPVRPIHFNIGATIAAGVTACPSTSLLLTCETAAVTCERCKRTKAYREATLRAALAFLAPEPE